MNKRIALLAYPKSLQSAIYGLDEMFVMANLVCDEQALDYTFHCDKLTCSDLKTRSDSLFDVVIIPPSHDGDFYLHPSKDVINWLNRQHANGAIIASACAGTFILAASQLLTGKRATTHWGLANSFKAMYPDIELTIDKILVNDIDIITAGGMMSWLDLGLEIIAQSSQISVMRQLGKRLVVDTGAREQSFYQQFTPILNHGDRLILSVQQSLQANFHQNISISDLAKNNHISERTFLRRFTKATHLKPSHYLQKLRIQRACELLESSQHSFEYIAYQVGYEDVSACRKTFSRIMGLTPSAFRQRFVR